MAYVASAGQRYETRSHGTENGACIRAAVPALPAVVAGYARSCVQKACDSYFRARVLLASTSGL